MENRSSKAASLACWFGLVLTAQAAGAVNQTQDHIAQARAFAALLGQGDYDAAAGMFHPALARTMDAQKLKTAWEGSTKSLGHFRRVLDVTAVAGRPAAVAACEFDKRSMDLEVRFAPDGHIMTFYLSARAGEPTPATTSAAAVAKPLSVGPWALGVAGTALVVVLAGGAAWVRRNRRSAGSVMILGRASPYVLGLALIYLLLLVLGLITGLKDGASAPPEIPQGQRMALEQMFGAFRGPLREGSAAAMLQVALIVFLCNLLGNVTNHTLPGVLVVPSVLLLGWFGWSQGTDLAGLTATSSGSIAGFLVVMWLETVTYLLAAAAGTRAGLAVLVPGLMGHTSRLMAFGRACKAALRVYAVIVIVLMVQALLEALYVRQVLLHGGSGIPLQPY